jgi:hypothetical protein
VQAYRENWQGENWHYIQKLKSRGGHEKFETKGAKGISFNFRRLRFHS